MPLNHFIMAAYFKNLSLLITAFVGGALYTSSWSETIPLAESTSTESTYLPQMVKSPKLDKTFTFAGEVVPLNEDTRQRLDRELMVNSYYHSSTLLALKRSTEFFPMIERILAEHDVPDDFKYLAVAESNLANAVSSAGAKGVWQFMRGASKDYKLEVNSEVDERYHVEKATHAAARYIKMLRNRYGSWANAAAAYNMGMGNLRKELRVQGQDSYYDLNVNSETSRYVFRIIALKEIMTHPEDYGFHLDPEDYYPELTNTYKVEINKTVPSWSAFAKQYGVTYRMLKFYNPWLKDSKLTVKKNTYYITLPR